MFASPQPRLRVVFRGLPPGNRLAVRALAMVALLVALAWCWFPSRGWAAEPTNPTCPVMEGEPVDPEVFLDHEGRRIWFCSELARELFADAPQDYLDKLPPPESMESPREFALIQARSAGDAGPTASSVPMPGLATLAGRLHPAAVHLPIGVVVAAFAISVCRLLRPNAAWCPGASAATFLMAIATAGAALAATSGWLLAGERPLDGPAAEVLELHRWLGVGTAWLCALVWWVLARLDGDRHRGWAVVALGGLSVLVGATGHLGGALVHGLLFLPF